MRRATPAKVDGDFLRANRIAPGNEYKVVGALRFLGLINEDGRPTEKSRLLKTMGTTFTSALQEIIRSAYSGLFQHLDVRRASKEDIYNYFVTAGGLGAEMAAKASRFFITLCHMAQIELTPTVAPHPVGRKTGGDSPHQGKSEAQARGNSATLPLFLALTPEVAEMDVEHLTELFRKLRLALDHSIE
jgi:hypothetical protein